MHHQPPVAPVPTTHVCVPVMNWSLTRVMPGQPLPLKAPPPTSPPLLGGRDGREVERILTSIFTTIIWDRGNTAAKWVKMMRVQNKGRYLIY